MRTLPPIRRITEPISGKVSIKQAPESQAMLPVWTHMLDNIPAQAMSDEKNWAAGRPIILTEVVRASY